MNFRPFASATRSAALALAGLTLAASCLAQTVTLGMVNSLTGPHSSFDLPASEGVQMAVDEINKRGGINVKGRKFTFRVMSEDAQSKPEMAVSGAQRLLRDDDIKVVFGILTSGPGMAAATAFGKSDVLYIGGFTLMDTLLGKPGAETMFRSLNNDATVAKSFVPTSVKELGVTKVGIMLPNGRRAAARSSRSTSRFSRPTACKCPSSSTSSRTLRTSHRCCASSRTRAWTERRPAPTTHWSRRFFGQATELGGLPKKFMYRGGSGAPALKYAKAV
jgi:hypothetical protein